jgi:ribosomal protein S8
MRFANSLSAINNACATKLSHIDIFFFKQNQKLVKSLFDLGFIRGFTYIRRLGKIRVFLKYFKNKSVMRSLNLVSKTTGRVYVSYKSLLQKKKFVFEIVGNNFLLFNTSSCSDRYLTEVELIMLRSGGELACIIK